MGYLELELKLGRKKWITVLRLFDGNVEFLTLWKSSGQLLLPGDDADGWRRRTAT